MTRIWLRVDVSFGHTDVNSQPNSGHWRLLTAKFWPLTLETRQLLPPFHEDLSFRCGDIRKTLLVFFINWFSMYFWYFCNYAPPKMYNYWMIVKWKHQYQCIFCTLRLSHKHIDFYSSQGTPCMILTSSAQASQPNPNWGLRKPYYHICGEPPCTIQSIHPTPRKVVLRSYRASASSQLAVGK